MWKRRYRHVDANGNGVLVGNHKAWKELRKSRTNFSESYRPMDMQQTARPN